MKPLTKRTNQRPIRPVHFLLIEDDPDHAELVRVVLCEDPAVNTIDHAPDGPTALAYLRREGRFSARPMPDVILLDLKLPGMSGHQVLEAIKVDPDLRQIPIVVLTTSDEPNDRREAYSRHANSYLVKPLGYEQFATLVSDMRLYWALCNEPPF